LNTKGKLAPNWFYLLMAYMHQIRFRLGCAPDPPLRELTVSQSKSN